MGLQDELGAIAREWIDRGWRSGDVGVVDDLHSPDFVDHDPAGRATDNEGFKEGIRDLLRGFPDLDTRVEEIVVDVTSSTVAVRWSAIGTHDGEFLGVRPSGKRVSFKGIEILRVRNGRIAERWGEWDGIDLLVQLGLVAL